MKPPSGGFLLREVIIVKHTFLSMSVGLILGFMFISVIENFRFVVEILLSVWAIRSAFSQW